MEKGPGGHEGRKKDQLAELAEISLALVGRTCVSVCVFSGE